MGNIEDFPIGREKSGLKDERIALSEIANCDGE